MAAECLEWMSEMVNRDENRVRKEISEKIGQVAYTPNQISKMLDYINRDDERCHLNSIRAVAINNNLTVNIHNLRISRSWRQGKYYVPASNLEALMGFLNLNLSRSDLERAAFQLGYSPNVKV